MPAVAQLYGQAITGAIFDALDVGFSGNPGRSRRAATASPTISMPTRMRSTMRASRTASTASSHRPTAAIGASTMIFPRSGMPDYRPRRRRLLPRRQRWRATGSPGSMCAARNSTAPLAAATHRQSDRHHRRADWRLSPDLLIGVLGGYEHFDYSSFSVRRHAYGPRLDHRRLSRLALCAASALRCSGRLVRHSRERRRRPRYRWRNGQL